MESKIVSATTVLVVGYGSIGSRHARLLIQSGYKVVVVSSQHVDFLNFYPSLEAAFLSVDPSYVIIANPTSYHHGTLTTLAKLNYQGIVLIEKPIFDCYKPIPENNFCSLLVAYNLRFHPIIQRIKKLLFNQKILSVQAYAGQFLPDWRPGSDYRSSYSASAKQGGGVIRDLSHELDYLIWILGGWISVSAIGGHFSNLEIDSDDIYSLMLTTPLCPVVNLQLNYLDRKTRRFLIINTVDHTIEADLVNGTLMLDKKIEFFSVDRDYTYAEMHRCILSKKTNDVCSYESGLDVLNLIESAELASLQNKWFFR